jgi:predicted transcriptional regulator of viral defense system
VPATNDERTGRKGLGERESRALSRLARQDSEIFTIEELADAQDTTYETAKDTASRLARNGWLARLKPGLYLIVPLAVGEDAEYTAHEFQVASHLADPMYVGFWSALDFHGFTEQVPQSVYVATTKRLADTAVHGVEYHRVTLAEKKFFGFEQYAVSGRRVRISTPEKTLVDCADQPRHCGSVRELAKGVRSGVEAYDPDVMLEHARRVGNGAAVKRLVYLMDHYDVPVPNRESVVDEFTTGVSQLDPTRSTGGSHSSEYRLELNVPERDLPEQR